MASCCDALLQRRAEQFGVQVESSLALGLQHLHLNAMRIGPCVLSNASHLPGDFHVGFLSPDGELVVRDLAGYDGLRELADDGELIAKITIQGLKPFG